MLCWIYLERYIREGGGGRWRGDKEEGKRETGRGEGWSGKVRRDVSGSFYVLMSLILFPFLLPFLSLVTSSVLLLLFFLPSLQSVMAKVPNAPVIAESLMMLKTLMNTPAGMKATVETPAMYKLVIHSIAMCGVSAEPPPQGKFNN